MQAVCTPKHPFLVPFLGHLKRAPTERGGSKEYCMLLEYCSKGSVINEMQQCMDAKKRLHETKTFVIFEAAVRGVKSLHDQSPPIAHRDIKIENILLGDDGRYKLCDFGSCNTDPVNIATSSALHREQEHIARHSTEMYRAPEMCDLYRARNNNWPITEQVDIWALGCVLYMLTHFRHPFEEGGVLGILSGKLDIPARSGYSKYANFLISKCFTMDPRARPTATQLLDMCQSWRVFLATKGERHGSETLAREVETLVPGVISPPGSGGSNSNAAAAAAAASAAAASAAAARAASAAAAAAAAPARRGAGAGAGGSGDAFAVEWSDDEGDDDRTGRRGGKSSLVAGGASFGSGAGADGRGSLIINTQSLAPVVPVRASSTSAGPASAAGAGAGAGSNSGGFPHSQSAVPAAPTVSPAEHAAAVRAAAAQATATATSGRSRLRAQQLQAAASSTATAAAGGLHLSVSSPSFDGRNSAHTHVHAHAPSPHGSVGSSVFDILGTDDAFARSASSTAAGGSGPAAVAATAGADHRRGPEDDTWGAFYSTNAADDDFAAAAGTPFGGQPSLQTKASFSGSSASSGAAAATAAAAATRTPARVPTASPALSQQQQQAGVGADLSAHSLHRAVSGVSAGSTGAASPEDFAAAGLAPPAGHSSGGAHAQAQGRLAARQRASASAGPGMLSRAVAAQDASHPVGSEPATPNLLDILSPTGSATSASAAAPASSGAGQFDLFGFGIGGGATGSSPHPSAASGVQTPLERLGVSGQHQHQQQQRQPDFFSGF
jgi:hypothetical protein